MSTFGCGLRGTKVGIVGLGRIGLAVAKRLASFEVSKIMYTATHAKPEGAMNIYIFYSLKIF